MEATKLTADAQAPASETRKSIYSNLPPDTIRIFELLPGENPVISGILHYIELGSEHIPYEALSYCWGEVDLRETIICDGFDIPVTSNLHQTLSQLRRQDTSLFLWIDAICINQGTDRPALKERAQQITVMSTIFSKADGVIIHFGQTTEDLSHLFTMLEGYVGCHKDDLLHTVYGDIILPGSEVSDLSDLRLWRQFLILIQMPWFKRLWCYQEFVLARRIVYMIGHVRIDHFDMHFGISMAARRFMFAQIENKLTEIQAELDARVFDINRVCTLTYHKHLARDQYRDGLTPALNVMLWPSRILSVTDPRDRLYAVYALLPSDITTDFRVDYSESMQALGRRFTARLIDKGYGVWPLMFAMGVNEEQPSWTMTLNAFWKNIGEREENFAGCAGSLNEFKPINNGLTFCAGGWAPHTIEIHSNPNQITARGLVDDSILHSSDSFQLHDRADGLDADEATIHFTNYIVNWAKNFAIPEDILWRLLILDGFGEIRHLSRLQDKTIRDETVREAFGICKRLMLGLSDGSIPLEDIRAEISGAKLYLRFYPISMSRMRLAVTVKGKFAVVPCTSMIDDEIAFLEGVNAPFVLRTKGEHYQIVGPCYVHEYMEGQILDDPDWKPKILTFV